MFVFGATPSKVVVKPVAPLAKFAQRQTHLKMTDGSSYDAYDSLPSDCNHDSLD